MKEICFCGWSDDLADREPIYVGDGEWGLACPSCRRVDRLEWLSDEARRQTLVEAWLRHARTSAPGHAIDVVAS
jgi:hypothetical protein